MLLARMICLDLILLNTFDLLNFQFEELKKERYSKKVAYCHVRHSATRDRHEINEQFSLLDKFDLQEGRRFLR